MELKKKYKCVFCGKYYKTLEEAEDCYKTCLVFENI